LSTLEARQAELQKRIDQIEVEIGQIDQEFTALAAAFNGIDGKDSLRQASALETRLSKLRQEKSLAMAAQAHCTKEQLSEKQKQAEAERRARQLQRRQLADGVATLNAELDAELVHLREMLERRAALLHQLGTHGCNPQILIKLGKSALTRAACFHRLDKFIDVNRCAPSAMASLASTNPILSGIGKADAVELPPSRSAGMDALTTAIPVPTNGGAGAENERNAREMGLSATAPASEGKTLGAETDEVNS
jgi:hypothetical protein